MALFRLLVGTHIENDRDGNQHVYRAGDVFESTDDLAKLNAPGMTPKFERVYQGDRFYAPAEAPRPTASAPPPSTASPAAAAGMENDVGGVPAPAPVRTPQQPAQPQTAQPSDPNAQKQAPAAPATPPARDLDQEYGGLEKLTVKELQEIAADEEIDLHGATKKDEILRALRGQK